MTPAVLLALLALAAGSAASAHAADAAPARCKYVQVGQLPLRYAGPGLVPAVEGEIDGMPATMLVDTGADGIYLTRTAAARRHLVLYPTRSQVSGIGGRSRMFSTRLKSLSIGPMGGGVRPELSVIADTTFAPDYDAIVGAAFLLQTDLELDLGDKRLRLFQPRDCDHAMFNIWKEDTVSVPFEGGAQDRSDNPHFAVEVNGVKLDAMIDSGAHRSVLAETAARERLGIDADSPGVVRLPDSGGIGSERAPMWSTPIASVRIGAEEIRATELGILATRGRPPADLILGQDFLRAHRVLFALGQHKLYLAYRGGAAFERDTGVEPWMRAEAAAGNPDAQYALALRYGAPGPGADPAQARIWLDQAAASGQPHANLVVGRRLLLAGRAADAIPKLRAALARLPSERDGALWLYTAQVQSGAAAAARHELETSLQAWDDDWPRPVALFYLGQLDEAGLLRAAADGPMASERTRLARRYIAEWQDARGAAAQAGAPRP